MQVRRNFKYIYLWLLLATLMYSNSAAAFGLNVATMVTNLANTMPDLMRLTTALGYVMGMCFILKSLIEFKHFSEHRTSQSTSSREYSLKTPLVYLGVGTALLYLPSSVAVGLSTFWNEPSPYAYLLETNDAWADLTNSCFMILQLIGTIAFIRGFVVLSHLSSSAQQGTFGRAMAHIIGGIFCINMYQFVQVVMATLGAS